MKEVNKDDFEDEVLNNDKPVIVDFWAEWCGPCRMLAPIFEKVAGQFEGKMDFVKLNVDNNQELAGKYDVRGIPCMIIFKDGQEVDRLVGALDEGTLASKVQSIVG